MESRLTAHKIPEKCLDWLISSRLKFLDDLAEGKPMRYFSAHLPVMATWPEGKGDKDTFPVNLTAKGIGLIPERKLLADYTSIFEVAAREDLRTRVEAVKRLYGRTSNFDPTLLGGLELFEGQAFKNMRENPCVSLLYAGMIHGADTMSYISFQINGRVEILDQDNAYYKFLLAARKLFEFEKFHLFQQEYPFGYIIRVEEVRDKSPWARGAR